MFKVKPKVASSKIVSVNKRKVSNSPSHSQNSIGARRTTIQIPKKLVVGEQHEECDSTNIDEDTGKLNVTRCYTPILILRPETPSESRNMETVLIQSEHENLSLRK
jgi:hypothetical protein